MDYNINILVVEDLLTTRLFLRKTLRKLGFNNVDLADDGESALRELKSTKYDLIVSDWNMPNMNGLEFFNKLQKDRQYRDIPFMLLTVEKEKEKVMEAFKAGIIHYMIKPVEPTILENKIKQVFDAA